MTGPKPWTEIATGDEVLPDESSSMPKGETPRQGKPEAPRQRKPDAPRSTRASQRSAARLAAVQALYQMDIASADLGEVLAEYESFRLGGEVGDEDAGDARYAPADAGFFRDIVGGVVREQRVLDTRIDAALASGWPLKRLDTTLRAILRAGAYELQFRRDVPPKAAITEYLEVGRAFYEGDETRMVNGVLDRLARELRPEEMAPRARG